MKTAVDTNVFSRIWLGGPGGDQAKLALRRCSVDGEMVVSAVVQAEMLANPMLSEEDVLLFLKETRIRVDYELGAEIWMEAGRRYRAYARRKRMSGGGDSRRIIADFVVGAHALFHAQRLLTYDVRLFQTNFPEVRLFSL